MQIQAIQSVPFKGTNSETKNTEKKLNLEKYNPAGYFSKSYAYHALKLSKGREKEDGQYKENIFLAGAGAVVASVAAFSKSVKSLAYNGKLNKAIKNSASKERIEELKKTAMKKQKGSTVALGISLALSLVAGYFWAKNKNEADKTAKERGFASDKEFTPELADKITLNNEAAPEKQEEIKEIKETPEIKAQEEIKPAVAPNEIQES